MSNTMTIKRCGVRFDPPAIIVIYTTPNGKTHRRTMPLRNFNKRSGVDRVAKDLRTTPRHNKYLENVPMHQLEKLISIIKDKMNGMELQESLEKNKKIDTIDPEEDLNKVSEEDLKRKKLIMDSTFEKNRIKPGDEEFQYDVEKDFGTTGGAIETCEWDSEGSDESF